jgi:hypothetical protein
MKDFGEKVAVVTGASGGIGAAFATHLAALGANVALVARREQRLTALADTLGTASAHPCDVADGEAVAACATAILERWGTIDLLINSAGYARHILFKDHDVADIERMMRTNYLGTVHWVKQALPALRGAGAIINISSFAGKIGQPDEAAYSASKFAVTGFSEALGHELAPLGIHVMAAHPVLVRTEMFTDEVMARMPPRTRNSFIEPEEFVAQTMRALARGKREVTIPRRFGWIYLLRLLAPRMFGRKMAAVRLDPLDDVTS